jgi:hypothetical protein
MTDKNGILRALASLEDLAEKKTKIYARLLTEESIAETMGILSAHHAERKAVLTALYQEKEAEEEEDET